MVYTTMLRKQLQAASDEACAELAHQGVVAVGAGAR